MIQNQKQQSDKLQLKIKTQLIILYKVNKRVNFIISYLLKQIIQDPLLFENIMNHLTKESLSGDDINKQCQQIQIQSEQILIENKHTVKDKSQEILESQIGEIESILQDLQFQALLRYADQLQVEKKLQKTLAFDLIFTRTCQQPQLVQKIKPTKRWIKNLIFVTTMISRKQLIYSIDNLTNREKYLTNYLLFIDNILDGNNNIINSSQKSKLLNNKEFINQLLAIQLYTTQNNCCAYYSLLAHSFIKLPLKLIPAKLLALSIIKNLKYLIHHQLLQLPLMSLNYLFTINKNLINFASIQKYNLIQNLQIIFETNKTNSACVQSLEILMKLIDNFKTARMQCKSQNPFNRFQLTKQMKQFILNDEQFKQHYCFYFYMSQNKITSKEMVCLFRYFISLINDALLQKQKLKQAANIKWLNFLLSMTETIIKKINIEEGVQILIKNGLINWGTTLLQSRLIDEQTEFTLIILLTLFLDHLEQDSPHHFHYYLMYSLNGLQFIKQPDLQWQQQFIHRFIKRIKQKLRKFSFLNLPLQ